MIEYPILYVVLEDEATKYRTDTNGCAESRNDLKRNSDVTSDVDIKKKKVVVDASDDVATGVVDASDDVATGVVDASDDVATGVEPKQPGDDVTSIDRKVQPADDVTKGVKTEQPGDDVTSIDKKEQPADDGTHADLVEQPGGDVTNTNESKQVQNGNERDQGNDAVTSELHKDVRGKDWWAENY